MITERLEEIYEGPSTSKGIRSCDVDADIPKDVYCIFCKNEKGPLSKTELSTVLTKKGFQSIIRACEERNDEVAVDILPYRRKFSEFPFKCHTTCRIIYTNRTRIERVKRAREESLDRPPDEIDQAQPPKRLSRQETALFDWNVHCFICSQVQDKNKTGRKFSLVNMNPTSLKWGCKSKTSCNRLTCVCSSSGIGCTDVCRCVGDCHNIHNIQCDEDNEDDM